MKMAVRMKELAKSEKDRSPSNDGEAFQFAATGGRGIIVSGS